MARKIARRLADVQAERAAKAAEQASRQRAKETRAKVRAVVTHRVVNEAPREPFDLEAVTTIKGQGKPHCYTDPIGPGRFTPERFFGDCTPESEALLRKAWKKGQQLIAARVPVDALPCVLIMAGFLRQYSVDLVDDMDALCQRWEDRIGDCQHADKYLASCVNLLHKRGMIPDAASFESVGIPQLYEELF